MLTGCSSVQTKMVKVYPDPQWTIETPLTVTKDMLSDYGKLRNNALPQAISDLDRCNAHKASIREWAENKQSQAK